jgi:hypothetical protein
MSIALIEDTSVGAYLATRKTAPPTDEFVK